jgi:hypothetical protein
MLLAQFSGTDRRYAFVLVICRPYQRLHLAHNFLTEVPPVLKLLKYLCGLLEHCRLNIRKLQVPARVPPAKHYSLQTLRQHDMNTDK